jgi:hypothetical protein
MKIFIAVFCALMLAFVIAWSWIDWNQRLDKWVATKNSLIATLNASYERVKESESESDEGEDWRTLGVHIRQLKEEVKLQKEALETIVLLFDHKPGALTPAETAQRDDFKANLAATEKTQEEMDKQAGSDEQADTHTTEKTQEVGDNREGGDEQAGTPTPIVNAPAPTPIPTPAPTPSAEEIAAAKREREGRAFAAEVADSQARALAKYPALGVQGSEINARFTFRYKRMKAASDPLLNQPDWPEKLADACAAAKY